ncbi:hypothetical protein EU546_00310 [Candidatus Thorarchaeota archaeon]|nr:MAG: hypothetical protein EU546_00310 [Candidatus Thorarchaeota archaeon]
MGEEEADTGIDELTRGIQRLRMWVMILGLLVVLLIIFEIPREPTGFLLAGVLIVGVIGIGVLEKYGIGS